MVKMYSLILNKKDYKIKKEIEFYFNFFFYYNFSSFIFSAFKFFNFCSSSSFDVEYSSASE